MHNHDNHNEQQQPQPEELSITPQKYHHQQTSSTTPQHQQQRSTNNNDINATPKPVSMNFNAIGQQQQQQQQSRTQSAAQQQRTNSNNNITSPTAAIASSPRDPSPDERGECDEYRISPVTVSVNGPLSLRFPGSDYGEVSVPSLSADVLVIASLADSHANGECSLGIHRSHVRNAHLDRETGVIQFDVKGVRSFGDTTIRLRAQDSALDLATKLLWLVTGHSSHASPAPELVTRAANALHAVAALKHESKKTDRLNAANFLNERRQNRRKLLQDKWDREESMEKETLITRNTIGSPLVGGSPYVGRSISEIMKDSSPVHFNNNGGDARAAYADQLRSMLMKGLANSPLHS